MGAYLGFTQQILTSYMAGKTVKAMFMADTYVEDVDTHLVVADVSAHEVSGAGYSAGGYTVTASIEIISGQVCLVVPDFTLENVTIEPAGIIFYVAQTGELICYDEFSEAVTIEDSNLEYIAPSDGVYVLWRY